MENAKINKKIIRLWKKYPKESGKYAPLLYPEFNKNGILFIGLNPSFSEKYFKKVQIDIKKLSKNNKDYDFIIVVEKNAASEGGYNYFARFYNISKYVGLHHQHIDLFYFRETTQKKAKEIIRKDTKELNGFAISQLKITIEIIKEISPKIVVVVNACASDLILERHDLFKINKKIFEKKGYYLLEINNRQIPIIFTSMLTGQRALDKHTFKKLKWDIKNIINKY